MKSYLRQNSKKGKMPLREDTTLGYETFLVINYVKIIKSVRFYYKRCV